MNTVDVEILSYYNSSIDFRKYVDRYAEAHRIENSEALTHSLVNSVMIYYKSKIRSKEVV